MSYNRDDEVKIEGMSTPLMFRTTQGREIKITIVTPSKSRDEKLEQRDFPVRLRKELLSEELSQTRLLGLIIKINLLNLRHNRSTSLWRSVQ